MRENLDDQVLGEVTGTGWQNTREQLGYSGPGDPYAGHSAGSPWPSLMPGGGEGESGMGGGVLPAVDGRIPWGS